MKHYNIVENSESGLGSFKDDRGSITDIFYKKSINHGCVISNTPGAVRGNHYHNHTIQYTYILAGNLTYYSQPMDKSESVSAYDAVPGDFIISDPTEIHAMKAGANGCVFIAFAEGPRGGEDYEKDTVRVDSIIPA
jgi:oxalate decarboxylase/phosphoglucose isomerase-like protein (cupin superfamily)